jgi:hypothetical protein
MDGSRFDDLARQLSSRRNAIGGLVGGLLLPLEAAARGKRKHKGKDRDRGKGRSRGQKRASAQAESCWRAGACIVSKGSNVSQCDLAGYVAPDGLDCTRCNLSRANLRGADLTGVNFTRANLSGACLVDADFTGATFANNTNLYNAIFCNTTMPDGSVNNSGCESGTPCCPICTPSCAGRCGGVSDGCGGACTGPCASGRTCLSNGTCAIPCPNSQTDCANAGCAANRCITTNQGPVCGGGGLGPGCDGNNAQCPVGSACAGTRCEFVC